MEKSQVTPAVTIQLVGGLGNQLFGYYAGKHIAGNLRSRLVLDISQKDLGVTAHGSSIKSFDLPEQVTIKPPSLQVRFFHVLLTKVSQIAPSLGLAMSRWDRIYTSSVIGLDPNIQRVRPGMLVRGYFQTYKYVQDARAVEGGQLQLKSASKWYRELFEYADKQRPIMVHIRRGDYALPINSHIGMLSRDYYINAISHLRTRPELQNSEVWVFSDEIEKVRAELGDLLDVDLFVAPPPGTDAAESMMLMATGSAVVISNSTFSWWSGILNNDGVVIAPKKWFKNQTDPEFIIPPTWVRLPSLWQ